MQIELDMPLDMHLHLRDDKMLNLTAPLSAKTFAGALIMPNLVPPITTKNMVISYKEKITNLTKEYNFTPFMTLFFKDDYNYDFLNSVKEYITAIKLYPSGITTNSENGISNFSIDKLRPTLEAMSELSIPLCVHGESDGFVLEREKEFIPIYENLAKKFPKLKIIMEHITNKETTLLLEKYENLYATITLHHLLIDLNDLMGGLLKPHLYCKPVAKTPKDRQALAKYALNAHHKVMFGSDSAPHPRAAKEGCGCAAGIFSAPIALQILADFFEKNNRLDNLNKFVSKNAKNIYELKNIDKKIILTKKEFTIPQEYKDEYNTVIPFMAGNTINWSIK